MSQILSTKVMFKFYNCNIFMVLAPFYSQLNDFSARADAVAQRIQRQPADLEVMGLSPAQGLAFFLFLSLSVYVHLSFSVLRLLTDPSRKCFFCTEIKFPSLAAWKTLLNQAPNAALNSNPFAFKRRRRPSKMSHDRWNVDISVGNESRCRWTNKHIAGRQMSVTAKPHMLQMYYRNFS